MNPDTCRNWPQRLETLKHAMGCKSWQEFYDRIGFPARTFERWRTRANKPDVLHAAVIEKFEQQFVFTDVPKKSQ